MQNPVAVDFISESSFFVDIGAVERRYGDLYVHHTIEIGFVIEGGGSLLYNGKKHALAVGDAYFIDSMTPHPAR